VSKGMAEVAVPRAAAEVVDQEIGTGTGTGDTRWAGLLMIKMSNTAKRKLAGLLAFFFYYYWW